MGEEREGRRRIGKKERGEEGVGRRRRREKKEKGEEGEGRKEAGRVSYVSMKVPYE
ncbi:hypothetical protein KIN20_026476 [Parelaphostrongylus tenuis]|uniref:Uncharacterized protein n=1 Tax=Parelaphostrongylus tenuis TaxID=148309 RepID=A0AAD5WCU8_PARTN|nr:hypothetical protein KIN20_026476 [Parelaphostrongylus tenuis]